MKGKALGTLAAVLITLGLLPGMAIAAIPTVCGGWSEDGAAIVSYEGGGGIAPASDPRHGGEAQNSKNGQGTGIKRAYGWTTWVGVYHYTTAQMEHSGIFCLMNGKVIKTSGRVWGNNGTEAYSPWATFNPDVCCGNLGSARTYYGC